MRVLIIEDDLDLAATVCEYLEAKGHEVDFAYDGLSGRRLASQGGHDVLILDLGLPGLDGLEVCRSLRGDAGTSVPILILTARDTLEDKLAGFQAGADDYLLKPFELAELVVRLEALVRRARGEVAEEILRVADLVIEPALDRITRAGQRIILHRIGVDILTLLARRAPKVVSREELEREVWGQESPDRDLLRSHLYLIRQAVDRPFDIDLVHTVRGRGVRLGTQDDISNPGQA